MATQSYPISTDGLALDVLIGLKGADMAALVGAGKPVPAPVQVRALLDTGTDVTCCAGWILRRFGLAPVLHHSTQTASGSTPVRLFEVSLSIPGQSAGTGPLLVLPQLMIMELPQVLPNVEALIGLDVLLQCELHMDGPGKKFTLSA